MTLERALLSSAAVLGTVLMLAQPSLAADLPTRKAPLAPAPVAALGWQAIIRANNQVGFDVGADRLNYSEVGASKLDTENGWLTHLGVSVSVQQNWGLDNLYVFGKFSWNGGNENYNGALQGGAYGTLQGTTHSNITDEDFRIGKGFVVGSDALLTPYIGVGARQWGRDLKGASGYYEKYTNGYVGVGVLAQYAFTQSLVGSVYGLIGSTFDAQLDVSSNGGAAVTPANFNLGSKATYQLGASVDYAITRNIHVNAGIDYAGLKYGKSAANANGQYEPNSTTNETVLKVGIGYAF